jgi:hypothetical protein
LCAVSRLLLSLTTLIELFIELGHRTLLISPRSSDLAVLFGTS